MIGWNGARGLLPDTNREIAPQEIHDCLKNVAGFKLGVANNLPVSQIIVKQIVEIGVIFSIFLFYVMQTTKRAQF
jgi:hypothetical protein